MIKLGGLRLVLGARTAVLLVLVLIIVGAARVQAFSVPPLPNDNLINNPWFRDPGNPSSSSLAGWTDAAGLNRYWSSSQKTSNPSPDSFASGACGNVTASCGTAARLSLARGMTGGVAEENVDAYLYQVVAANPANRKLRFFTHWVSHLVAPGEVTIYGGATAAGPWEAVWVPLRVFRPDSYPIAAQQDDLWEYTNFNEQIVDAGYAFYRVEVHANLPPAGANQRAGFKVTGVYFAAVDVDAAAPPLPFDQPPATATQAAPPSSSTPVSGPTVAPPATDTGVGATATTASAAGLATPPPAPSPNVEAVEEAPVLTGVLAAPGTVELTWTKMPSNRRGYRLERTTDLSTSWRILGQVSADATSYQDQRLDPGLIYYYRLRFAGEADDAGVSNTVMVDTKVASPTPVVVPTAETRPTRTATATSVATPVEVAAIPSATAVATRPGAVAQPGGDTSPPASGLAPILWLTAGLVLGVIAFWLLSQARNATTASKPSS